MSIFALVSGVVAKFVLPDVEVTQLKAEVDDLKRQLNEARMHAVDLRNEAYRWQRLYEEALDPQRRERRRQIELCQAMATRQATQMAQNIQMAQHAPPAQRPQMEQQSIICHCAPGRRELLLGPRGL